jgi:hypothetical protein
MEIRVGPYTTVEEILMDPTLEPKRDDRCPRSPFLVRVRLALDPHFEVLDWRSIFDKQNFTVMTGVRRQIEWFRFQCGKLTVHQIRFIFAMDSDGYVGLSPSQRAGNEDELSEPPSDADLTGSLDEADIHVPITADDVLPTQFPLGNRSPQWQKSNGCSTGSALDKRMGIAPPRESAETAVHGPTRIAVDQK